MISTSSGDRRRRDRHAARANRRGGDRSSGVRPIRSIPIRERCSRRSPRAIRRPPIRRGADGRERRQSARLVSDPAGLPAAHRRSCESGRWRFARRARGADRRRRRRIRLGQDDARPRDPAAHPLAKGRSPIAAAPSTASTQRQMRPLRREMQIVFQDPYGSLSPRMSVAEIVEEGLIAQERRALPPSARRVVEQRARRHRARSLDARPLSA